ncbi:MAG: glycosyltransferase family 2 protein [Chloroflexota bacterium]
MTIPEPTLTIIAMAWNEADHLGPCFKSLEPLIQLTGADTLVLLNDNSDKPTVEAAHRVAGRVASTRFENFSNQRNRALALASTRWVFFIDPDERCTPALAVEIANAIAQDQCAAFRVSRRNFLFGKEIRHTGWWPDYQTRLFEREGTYYDEQRQVHEYPVVSGETCILLNPLIHFNYETWGQFVRKQRSYAPLEAQALYNAGTRARLQSFIGQPLREFKRRYIDYEGYRDGLTGLALSIAMSLYRAETYRQLRRIQRSSPE